MIMRVMLMGVMVAPLVGCASGFTERAQHGITFYCPGAGNIDFGDNGIRQGLEQAGYKGQVASLTWTVGFNPAIDQTLVINAQAGAASLAKAIQSYRDKYPDKPLNVIGLSAGTGVAVWALEKLEGDYDIDNLVLLASSLSYDYDMTRASERVRGRIVNYYSSADAILAGPMKIFGTIDRKIGVDGAGAVGLKDCERNKKIVNVKWRPGFKRYGYYGGHTDVTNPAFVRAVIAKHIIHRPPVVQREKQFAIASATALRDAPAD